MLQERDIRQKAEEAEQSEAEKRLKELQEASNRERERYAKPSLGFFDIPAQ